MRGAVPDAPLLVGSGLTEASVAELSSLFDGAIVGTAAKRDGRTEQPVDPARARALVAARAKTAVPR